MQKIYSWIILFLAALIVFMMYIISQLITSKEEEATAIQHINALHQETVDNIHYNNVKAEETNIMVTKIYNLFSGVDSVDTIDLVGK